jgi:hypothetical protein
MPYGKGTLPIVAASGKKRVVRLGERLVEKIVAPRVVALPVRKGQRLGSVRVYRGGRLIASSPLVASKAVAKPGALGRAGWYAGETADTVWSWLTP